MPKNNFVSTNASSPPTKVTWECSSNTQDDTEKGSKVLNINQEAPEKETRMPKNYFVSTIASSSPAKVTWKKGSNGYQKFKEQLR